MLFEFFVREKRFIIFYTHNIYWFYTTDINMRNSYLTSSKYSLYKHETNAFLIKTCLCKQYAKGIFNCYKIENVLTDVKDSIHSKIYITTNSYISSKTLYNYIFHICLFVNQRSVEDSSGVILRQFEVKNKKQESYHNITITEMLFCIGTV